MKNINWERVIYWIIHIMFILIFNTPLWVYWIGSVVPYATIGEFRLSWIDYLRLSDRVEWYHIWFLYIGILVGLVLTFLFIKGWINAFRKEKDKKEMLAANEANTNKIIEALQAKEKKELDKKIKKAKKYLGD